MRIKHFLVKVKFDKGDVMIIRIRILISLNEMIV